MASLGEESENRACRYLKQEGYLILARNWRTRAGEVDIIARDGGVLAFVEVKFRAGDGFGGPEAAVDRAKQRRLVSAARSFIGATKCELPMRFDVVAVRPGKVRLYQDAFQVED
jgi:putative endonuclease